MMPPKLTVIHDGVGRDYRGRNGQRRLAKVLSELLLLEADQLAARTRAERLRRREARDDGGGDCRASGSDGHMSGCLDGAWMSSDTRGLSRDRWLVPFGASLTV